VEVLEKELKAGILFERKEMPFRVQTEAQGGDGR
jgi:hypothetical protein